ncbi:uncharacterized protein AMSG_04542 [Thecamonas trahens ATCC 50062]|uniref:Uncharacterized protein n=1 Tax=Thecamonas trahens ATCC 50062 TaxID=461836 RepID=A0A0L0D8A4_THETB|nr:hypothetical protein AMSG_04542 [Thecamonas trahens ATCC 50062]KNC48311.1 hypothetical protein AMSG_04542 [Thecamonas trahens ATCC 50062]|eukprot:XP_013758878.1 hypothetical protein AMSG_04542 [Thecamonas trahens ATCC 50062]
MVTKWRLFLFLVLVVIVVYSPSTALGVKHQLVCDGVCDWSNKAVWDPPHVPNSDSDVVITLESGSDLKLTLPTDLQATARSMSVTPKDGFGELDASFSVVCDSSSSIAFTSTESSIAAPRLNINCMLNGPMHFGPHPVVNLKLAAVNAAFEQLGIYLMVQLSPYISTQPSQWSSSSYQLFTGLVITDPAVEVIFISGLFDNAIMSILRGPASPSGEPPSLPQVTFNTTATIGAEVSNIDLKIGSQGAVTYGNTLFSLSFSVGSIDVDGGKLIFGDGYDMVVDLVNPRFLAPINVRNGGEIHLGIGTKVTLRGVYPRISHGTVSGPGTLVLAGISQALVRYDMLRDMMCSDAVTYIDKPAVMLDNGGSPQDFLIPLTNCDFLQSSGAGFNLSLVSAMLEFDDNADVQPNFPPSPTPLVLGSHLQVSMVNFPCFKLGYSRVIFSAPKIVGHIERVVADRRFVTINGFGLASAIEHDSVMDQDNAVVYCTNAPAPAEWQPSSLTAKQKHLMLAITCGIFVLAAIGASVWVRSFGLNEVALDIVKTIRRGYRSIKSLGGCTVLAAFVLTAFLAPFVVEGAVMAVAAFALLPLAWMVAKLESRALPLYFLIVLFIHFGGLADLLADIALLVKVVIVSQRDQYSDSSSSSSSSSYRGVLGAESSESDEDEVKEQLETTFLIVRLILTIVGVIPSMVVYKLSAEMSRANRITANRAEGLPDDTDKSRDPPDLTCQNAPMFFMMLVVWKIGLAFIRVKMMWMMVKSMFRHGFRTLDHATHHSIQKLESLLALDLLWSGLPLGVLTATELIYFNELSHIAWAQQFEIIKLSALAIDCIGFCALVYMGFAHGPSHGHSHSHGDGSDHERIDHSAPSFPTERTRLINH